MFVYLQNLSTVSFLTFYLQDRTQRVFLNGQYSTEGIVGCGILQGSILGPLLFCIFINDLPLNITNDNVVCDLFADDHSIHSCGSDLQSVQKSFQEGLNDVSAWFDQNRMATVQHVREHRVLDVIIDEELKWQSYIDNICKHVSKNLFLLSQLRHYVDSDARNIFFQAHLYLHINYASTVWNGVSEGHLKKLNSIHRRAAKLILPDQSLSTTEKLNKLNILPLDQQLNFNRCITMFKIHSGKAPPFLSDILHRSPARYGSNNYVLPRPRIDQFKTSFAFSGSSTWNILPPKLKTFSSLCNFKINLRKFLHSTLS